MRAAGMRTAARWHAFFEAHAWSLSLLNALDLPHQGISNWLNPHMVLALIFNSAKRGNLFV
jgi:hypothetical protein